MNTSNQKSTGKNLSRGSETKPGMPILSPMLASDNPNAQDLGNSFVSKGGNVGGQTVGSLIQSMQNDLHMMSKTQQSAAKEGSVQLKTDLRDLKDNYHVIESKITKETLKQRTEHKEKYAQALDRI